ncbi:palmitoyl-protein thioesterase family protein [Aspergillus clavatus NRRL 1]|uniref:Palmitoyl-protein thioesterase 1 n=1 Tax=Aspergillus clavatus (strain ATCC 1007 / CBS 513.65 / DSM 816 / NCTC 3887 / NRRL 1 / QM 1276 / 107) TaxID=344612 RepID=A1CL89_ASPCL|nr:palmitoyl-protein thioesterase precursor [Aspergillus clavatus NRRL 1]EAW09913.1 palmitoyl-protein thioesterase precursor [Aspergillus clavatus NRRL 1]
MYLQSHLLLPLLSLPLISSASPLRTHGTELTPLPLIIWHGLGDDFQRDGMKEVAALADQANPGTYIHLIHVGDTAAADRQASFLGNVTEQIDLVCAQLAADPILSTAPAVNALGFSQGGQFLRGYVERCNAPPVHNLVTFGSQHNGIAEFQACGATDWVCRGAEALLRAGRWSAFVQARLVPAQYFRDPAELDAYLANSNFLADINNERPLKNTAYRANLARLNRFAMYMFEDDTMVNPKESAWFAEVNATTGAVTPLRERSLYKEDWLGLKALDEQGKLDFRTAPGGHMQLSEKLLSKVFEEYFGPVEVDVPMSVLTKQLGH